MSIQEIISKLKNKKDLNGNDLLNIVHDFEKKILNDKDIEDFVIAWREKKETPEELKLLVELLFKKSPQIDLTPTSVIDMCGTGGDRLNTINISTLSAIVVSSYGLPVIKHSGRSSTGISGSVDVLSDFGFDVDNSTDIREACFKKLNLMFVSSKLLRELFGNVKRVCKKLNIPGFVNLLGPLTNPYKTSFHLLGVSSLEWGDLLANTLNLMDYKNGLIVCSKVSESSFMDELSFCGKNYLWKINNGKVTREEIDFSKYDFKSVNCQELVIKNKAENKLYFENILSGKLAVNDPKLQVIALNSGAAIYLIGQVKSIVDGYKLALQHIQAGKPWEHFLTFLNCSKREVDFNSKN